jgi:hypothetical protein
MKKKQERANNRNKFLNEVFFPDSAGYEAKQINENWVLVRQFVNNKWVVAIYPKTSYEKSRVYYQEKLLKSRSSP